MNEFWVYILLGFFAGIITTVLFMIGFIKKIIYLRITKENEKQ